MYRISFGLFQLSKARLANIHSRCQLSARHAKTFANGFDPAAWWPGQLL
jgi:hypothetical protein